MHNKTLYKKTVQIVILIIFVFSTIVKTNVKPASAASNAYGQLWYQVTVDNQIYSVNLKMAGNAALPVVLNESSHRDVLENIYVFDASGSLVTNKSISQRAVYLAQTRGFMLADESLITNVPTWLDPFYRHGSHNSTEVHAFVDNLNNNIFIRMPTANDPDYQSDAIDILRDYEGRVNLYEEVIRVLVFPPLNDDGGVNLRNLEETFDTDLGSISDPSTYMGQVALAADLIEAERDSVEWAISFVGILRTGTDTVDPILVILEQAGYSVPSLGVFGLALGALQLSLLSYDATATIGQAPLQHFIELIYYNTFAKNKLT
jgi:hypothetical protein